MSEETMASCSTESCRNKANHGCWECGKQFCQSCLIQSDKHRVGWICKDEACAKQHREPAVWRVNIAPGGTAAYDLAITQKKMGTGWKISDYPDVRPNNWEDFELRATEHNGGTGWKNLVSVLENNTAVGDLVWTRSTSSRKYYLGRITGDWQYVTNEPFWSAGLVNVRDCEWQEVPQDVLHGSLLHLRNASIREVKGLVEYSKSIYNSLNAEAQIYQARPNTEDFWNCLGPDDLEDAVGIYLQLKLGYVIYPSSCKQSTPDVECFLGQRETGALAYMQVKDGKASINLDAYAQREGDGFFFSPSGNYAGDRGERMTLLDPKEVELFLRNNRAILSSQLKFAVDNSGPSSRVTANS